MCVGNSLCLYRKKELNNSNVEERIESAAPVQSQPEFPQTAPETTPEAKPETTPQN